MTWRVYRLPGSRELWHVDSGPDTAIINVRGFEIFAPCKSVDLGNGFPRAWIEVRDADLHLMGGLAIWTLAAVGAVVPVDVGEAVPASAGVRAAAIVPGVDARKP